MALSTRGRGLVGGGASAVVVETVLGTGQFVATFVDFFLTNVEMFIPLFSTIANRLAPALPWLPADLMSQAVLVVSVIYVAVTIGRIIKQWNNDR